MMGICISLATDGLDLGGMMSTAPNLEVNHRTNLRHPLEPK